jgi:hypothetical protein
MNRTVDELEKSLAVIEERLDEPIRTAPETTGSLAAVHDPRDRKMRKKLRDIAAGLEEEITQLLQDELDGDADELAAQEDADEAAWEWKNGYRGQ